MEYIAAIIITLISLASCGIFYHRYTNYKSWADDRIMEQDVFINEMKSIFEGD